MPSSTLGTPTGYPSTFKPSNYTSMSDTLSRPVYTGTTSLAYPSNPQTLTPLEAYPSFSKNVNPLDNSAITSNGGTYSMMKWSPS